ncbi:MAG: 30S ribosomal protein S8, partial [bacterium]
AIEEMRRISKPGKRIYVAVNELRRVRSGFGLAILSTSKGIMSDTRARAEKVGGEMIGRVL